MDTMVMLGLLLLLADVNYCCHGNCLMEWNDDEKIFIFFFWKKLILIEKVFITFQIYFL